MINIQLLREDPGKFKKAVKDKQMDPSLVDKLLEIDERRRKLIGEIETLRAERNEIAKSKNIVAGKQVKEELKKKEPELDKAEKNYFNALNLIPNPALDMVPVGKDEKDNVEVRKWGEPKKFNFAPKDHLELGKALGILDFETGAKVAGSQFYYLYGDGALMELALIHYAFDKLTKEGFLPVITPDLAKSRYYLGTGYMPKGDEAQTYEIKDEDLGLIATAEVTLAGKHADEVIPEDKLPLKYIGYSHCFRKEAGAYGKYSKGIYRVHQFTKAEMFIYCIPEESNKMHEYLLKMEEEIYQELGLPYRVLEMCTGDLGAMAARKFDIEAWMPSRDDYGEVTSTSNCTDYQARNLNIKYRTKDGKTDYVHMLNGTAIATSRTPLAILENYQQKDGSVVVPEVLRKWIGKDVIKK
ncbi:serine--tRNA ligase [Candidatus Woesebacteria bacterium RIFCSPHIGHO2_02_FULL_42_20]|uniref:Serine--tRNA ligase n=1 Tax=Candidatus Woesebacteria bacterium RIFCSPHIGHO2_12_FULL_41_24 TaxID=1802510 RepID=A0A1F8AU00_9BACT|nr:MAG: serine--tRNA ligase [Candidatus Woesebacteria bacterium RBG_16_41_13]OGM29634.1 MAG: serine--tRNA ligase [Candidatus Woesebacteria bacterium RIFCSPHIGHO2_01_FULL_42_80]OGM35611.1 MAG: serine--tRNA ligase [Candidatus Woesebacteria bacterium RIFCSPHIGHO2_02_FULL_42_20]OGM55222.1 MAG: serine--tRNA ligase [Candidatus Woesebacteria bacterium RIFCSPHIGHO2_12_FULL_41_24]OGM67176.1 MAG: serine--tRNA ligase [Candidatus Woesebacteria bacterium RIFCSPLOWO2_01_FULL_42_67]OGM71877.1 MAG: serine--tR